MISNEMCCKNRRCVCFILRRRGLALFDFTHRGFGMHRSGVDCRRRRTVIYKIGADIYENLLFSFSQNIKTLLQIVFKKINRQKAIDSRVVG